MRLKTASFILCPAYFLTLALAWIYADPLWRDGIFYLTFISGFGLNAALGYLLAEAEKAQ